MKNHLSSLVLTAALTLGQHPALAQNTSDSKTETTSSSSSDSSLSDINTKLRRLNDDLNRTAKIASQDVYRDAEKVYRDFEKNFAFTSPGPDWARSTKRGTLIIPKETADPKVFGELQEDLAVMSRILGKVVGTDGKTVNAMGIAIQKKPFRGTSASRDLYIEGYGAIFFLDVNFPLLPPPKEATEAEAKQDTSNEWEEARRELSSPPKEFPNYFGAAAEGVFAPAGEEYDADKVNDLKQNLLAALKNAAHIRKLKSDEVVTVVVTGRATGVNLRGLSRVHRSDAAPTPPPPPTMSSPAARETKLVIRARRSDIEAFQKDRLSADDFRKKATLMIY